MVEDGLAVCVVTIYRRTFFDLKFVHFPLKRFCRLNMANNALFDDDDIDNYLLLLCDDFYFFIATCHYHLEFSP